jgi:endonuclease/exonuclease/phosphatase family metal-dependent hydrolase
MARRFSIVLLLLCAAPVWAQHTGIRAMTLNTKHGGQAPWSLPEQVSRIVAESPDIVFLQEANTAQLAQYVAGINAGLKTSAWHGEVSRHCVAGSAPSCTSVTDQAVMILSRFKFTDVDPRIIWAADDFFAARAVLRVRLLLDDGTPLQAFSCHLPALASAARARAAWVATFKDWATTYPGPQIVGGDFNEAADAPAVMSMAADYVDAWKEKGAGSGATHSGKDGIYRSRIDYLFSAGGVAVESAFVPQVEISDHRPVVANYTVPSRSTIPPRTPTAPGPAEDAVVLEDNFDAGTLDQVQWPGGVYSGNTHDNSVGVVQGDGSLSIGPLKPIGGWHYNAVSSGLYALSGGGYAQAQLAQGVVGADAYAMFTAGSDGSNFYRIFQSGRANDRALQVEKKIDGVKHALANAAFHDGDQPYLRIRHDYRPQEGVDDVVFEISETGSTADALEWYRERWDPSVVASALSFELKAGTSGMDAEPSVVRWDNFRAAQSAR